MTSKHTQTHTLATALAGEVFIGDAVLPTAATPTDATAFTNNRREACTTRDRWKIHFHGRDIVGTDTGQCGHLSTQRTYQLSHHLLLTTDQWDT